MSEYYDLIVTLGHPLIAQEHRAKFVDCDIQGGLVTFIAALERSTPRHKTLLVTIPSACCVSIDCHIGVVP